MTTNANTRPSEYVPSGAEVEAAAKSLAADEFRKADWNDIVMARNALVAARAATPTPPTDMVPAAALAEALSDIAARRREFQRLGADNEYISALEDAYGLVNNRLRGARSAPTKGRVFPAALPPRIEFRDEEQG